MDLQTDTFSYVADVSRLMEDKDYLHDVARSITDGVER